ncbi:MAG TPA: STAS/SEC14 domain-containing protein [Candidatus Dormibacteraeota bacterium]|nr:STAS/SEC14 domain-containing protein [Candidatus Dormibacteraeota bacterium]
MTPTDGAGGEAFFNRPGIAVVSWEAASRAVYIEWQGWATPDEFAAALDSGVATLIAHHSTLWLADCRGMKTIQQSDQEWLDKHWFPRVLAAGLKRMALVIPISGLAKMNLEEIMGKVPNTDLEVGFFATVAEARTWLTARPTSTPSGLTAIPVS